MKPLFVIGLVLVVLGLLAFVIPIPRSEKNGVTVAGVSLGVETHHDERLSPIVGAVLILAGAGLAFVGKQQG